MKLLDRLTAERAAADMLEYALAVAVVTTVGVLAAASVLANVNGVWQRTAALVAQGPAR
jgi:Flp pilus assembly pilin Flp